MVNLDLDLWEEVNACICSNQYISEQCEYISIITFVSDYNIINYTNKGS